MEKKQYRIPSVEVMDLRAKKVLMQLFGPASMASEPNTNPSPKRKELF